jgi:hypothetical protein
MAIKDGDKEGQLATSDNPIEFVAIVANHP